VCERCHLYVKKDRTAHKKATINNIKNGTINITSEELADRGAVVLSLGLSMRLGMTDFVTDDVFFGTDAGTSVIRVNTGAAGVLQLMLFRTFQCKFSYPEGPLQVRFGGAKSLLEI
jgi:hypothetical protein